MAQCHISTPVGSGVTRAIRPTDHEGHHLRDKDFEVLLAYYASGLSYSRRNTNESFLEGELEVLVEEACFLQSEKGKGWEDVPLRVCVQVNTSGEAEKSGVGTTMDYKANRLRFCQALNVDNSGWEVRFVVILKYKSMV